MIVGRPIRSGPRPVRWTLVLVATLLASGPARADDWRSATVVEGRQLFASLCAACHGDAADGRSPAAQTMDPLPRDLTRGEYRFRSTASGRLPLRRDMLRTLSEGLPGTEMPAWGDQLSRRQLQSLVLFLETLSERFAEQPRAPKHVLVGPDVAVVPPSKDLLERGRVLYKKLRCGKCHGETGRGDGVAAATIKNNDGSQGHVFDFTYGVYKGGYSPLAVYRTFVTGLDGTPMPSYARVIPAERDRWALVHYCRSLSRSRGAWFYLKRRPTWEEPILPPAQGDDGTSGR